MRRLSVVIAVVAALLGADASSAVSSAQAAASAPIKGPGCATSDEDFGTKGVVTLGTWNVAGAVVTGNTAGWKWGNRREEMISMLSRCAADVYTLQEASGAWLPGGTVDDNQSQYEQIVEVLNDKLASEGVADRYALTNAARNNCRDDRDCVTARNHGKRMTSASNDNRIIYNTATVRMVSSAAVDQGYGFIPGKDPNAMETVAYATFETLSTHKRFFVATTHLTSGEGRNWDNYKRSQMQRVLEYVKARNSARVPAIIAGDLNSSRYVKWANAADKPAASSMRFVDVIGTDRRNRSDGSRGSCTVQNSSLRVPYLPAARINAYYNSSNGQSSSKAPTKNQCPGTKWNQNGRAIDYVFTSRNIRPKVWETVINHPDGKGYYRQMNDYLPSARRTPSDHNLIVTKLVLLDAPAW